MFSLTVAYAVLRRQQGRDRHPSMAAELRIGRLESQLAELAGRLSMVEGALNQREITPARPAPKPPARSSLDRLESLADEDQLHSGEALRVLADAVVTDDATFPSDPFAGHQESIAIARLADRGYSAVEIASQLHKPLGEVELLLSLRPVRDAA